MTFSPLTSAITPSHLYDLEAAGRSKEFVQLSLALIRMPSMRHHHIACMGITDQCGRGKAFLGLMARVSTGLLGSNPHWKFRVNLEIWTLVEIYYISVVCFPLLSSYLLRSALDPPAVEVPRDDGRRPRTRSPAHHLGRPAPFVQFSIGDIDSNVDLISISVGRTDAIWPPIADQRVF